MLSHILHPFGQPSLTTCADGQAPKPRTAVILRQKWESVRDFPAKSERASSWRTAEGASDAEEIARPFGGEAGGSSAEGEISLQKASKPVIYLKKWRKHAEFADLTAASW
ncbi:hypothetical protein J2805_002745 [Arthrobacter oryzae]|nr:hypothetical protein [Arthrobacter oryzae]